MNSRFLTLCALLALGPPAAMFAYHNKHLFNDTRVIDPHIVDGQLLVFTANWCGACQRMKPVVSQLSREGFDIRVIDVGSNQQKAERYGVHAIPTFVLVRNGQEVRRQSGSMSAEKLKQIWR